MLCFSMNSGIAPVRSSSELVVHCTGKASKKNISCPSIVTNRENIRHREASSQPQELVRHWTRTATGHSLSESV